MKYIIFMGIILAAVVGGAVTESVNGAICAVATYLVGLVVGTIGQEQEQNKKRFW